MPTSACFRRFIDSMTATITLRYISVGPGYHATRAAGSACRPLLHQDRVSISLPEQEESRRRRARHHQQPPMGEGDGNNLRKQHLCHQQRQASRAMKVGKQQSRKPHKQTTTPLRRKQHLLQALTRAASPHRSRRQAGKKATEFQSWRTISQRVSPASDSLSSGVLCQNATLAAADRTYIWSPARVLQLSVEELSGPHKRMRLICEADCR